MPRTPNARDESLVTQIHVPELQHSMIKLRIVGTTPMFMNRMTAKAKRTLLVGGRKKTQVERAEIKHNPLDEYRDSAEILRDQTAPTALGLRLVAFKAAMCTAAIETAGITKTSAQRLLFLPGEVTPLYGVPLIRLDTVRSADINRTPDVRARAYLPRWGAEIEVHAVVPQLPVTAVVTLAVNAGLLIGLGDFRQEKGKGNFGLFRVIAGTKPDAEWDELVAAHGREAQLDALAVPSPADADTAELLEFVESEQRRRAA